MKERLTGAIILVVLVVLLVPELLSGPKGSAPPVPAGAASPSSEEPPLKSYTINLGDDSHSQTETGGATSANGPAMPQPSGPAQPTTQTDSSASTGDASDQTGGEAAASSGSQDGQPSSAQGGSQSATAAQAESWDQPKPHQSAPTPAAKDQRAAKASASQPATPKPIHVASAPEKPAKTKAAPAEASKAGSAAPESGAWGVQLGLFANRENAERLALDVRTKGFKASVSPVTSGGHKLYRVRVGPTADRSAAQELQGRLKAAGRGDARVVPYS